jgi:hypothetical protein
MTDNVNHLSHCTYYQGLEIIELTEQMNFNLGNAVKYIAKAGLKNPETEIEDLEKAIFYIKREEKRTASSDAIYSSTYGGLMNILVSQLGKNRGLAVTDICWQYRGSLGQATYHLRREIEELKYHQMYPAPLRVLKGDGEQDN